VLAEYFRPSELKAIQGAGGSEFLGSGTLKRAYEVGLSCVKGAAENGNAECLRVLVKKGFTISAELPDFNPVHLAVKVGSTECLDILLEAGFDVNVRDKYDRTPLHYATSVETVRCLGKHNCRVQETDHNGETVLIAVTKTGKLDVLKCVLDLIHESIGIRNTGTILNEAQIAHAKIVGNQEERVRSLTSTPVMSCSY
jgi:ankyrin repeat protein